MSEIVCPNCGVDQHLSGQRHGDLIRITCSAGDLSRTPRATFAPAAGLGTRSATVEVACSLSASHSRSPPRRATGRVVATGGGLVAYDRGRR